MPKERRKLETRSATTEKRLDMYNTRAKRDKQGKVLWEAYQSKDKSHQARIQPDRRWFGGSRTVTQNEMTKFRDEIEKQKTASNTYILKSSKLPMSLLKDSTKVCDLLIVRNSSLGTQGQYFTGRGLRPNFW